MSDDNIEEKKSRTGEAMLLLLYTLATIQVVWAYHSRVPSYLRLDKYENGIEVTPCQTRVLMMLVLRWAHSNTLLVYLANLVSTVTPIYRTHIRPETFVIGLGDMAGIAMAGWVATRIYSAASTRHLLTPYVYGLVLVFCAGQYLLLALHVYRFYYDLPSLGFFSAGLYLIYFRKNPLVFAALFVVATLNRETTLLLLLLFVLASVADGPGIEWRRICAPRTTGTVVPLGVFWCSWHVLVNRHFAHNHFAYIPASLINTVLLFWPPAWPQMLTAGCFSIPLLVAYRKTVRDRTLRLWLWVLPAWFAIIYLFGIIVEVRLYGELIPYFACMAALVAEEAIVSRFQAQGWSCGSQVAIAAGQAGDL
ncbi:MAG TPA: hypothetical protein VFN53_13995 [Acidobacteriaceae bacterium]|nr:hypothetical protein [Acidobacteriaceae bacterium]